MNIILNTHPQFESIYYIHTAGYVIKSCLNCDNPWPSLIATSLENLYCVGCGGVYAAADRVEM